MKQGDLFDDLYVEQQTDERHIHPGHMGCEVLYQGPIEGVIKQRLVTYAKDEFGNIKRIEKVRMQDMQEILSVPLQSNINTSTKQAQQTNLA